MKSLQLGGNIPEKCNEKTTGNPIKWIICFSVFASVIESFLTKDLHKKNHEICRKFKKYVLGPAVYNPPRGKTSQTKI